MAAFMKGDRVAIIDPVSPFRMRPGRISDIQFTSNNDLFYKVDITHTENSVWVDERNIIRLMEPEQELWNFFIYRLSLTLWLKNFLAKNGIQFYLSRTGKVSLSLIFLFDLAL